MLGFVKQLCHVALLRNKAAEQACCSMKKQPTPALHLIPPRQPQFSESLCLFCVGHLVIEAIRNANGNAKDGADGNRLLYPLVAHSRLAHLPDLLRGDFVGTQGQRFQKSERGPQHLVDGRAAPILQHRLDQGLIF